MSNELDANSLVVPVLNDEFIEIEDPQTGKTFYANIVTGECTWDKPMFARIKTKQGQESEWWELFDENHKLPYYYNSKTGETEWLRPMNGTIVPVTIYAILLIAIQNSSIGKRVSVHIKRASMMNKFDDGGVNVLHPGMANLMSDAPPKNIQYSDPPHKAAELNALSFSSCGSALEDDSLTPLAGGKELPSTPPHQSAFSSSLNSLSSLAKTLHLTPSMPLIYENANDTPKTQQIQHENKIPYDQTKIPDRSSMRSLPPDLKSHIQKFKIDGFAEKYFSEHRIGIFRRKVPVQKMLVFQKDSLKSPLLVLNKSAQKDALKCFKLCQRIMGDRPPSSKTPLINDIQALAEVGILRGELRDEIYVQICKQLTNNPNGGLYGNSVFRGWQLMCVLVTAFPPSKNLEDYMKSFVVQASSKTTSPSTGKLVNPINPNEINILSKHCSKQLEKTCKVGPKGKPLTIPEIERGMAAPFKISIFGETLEEIMKCQIEEKIDLTLDIPKILPFSFNAIIQLGGCRTEGIFRVPGDADGVTDLRCRIELGKYDFEGITDPNVPSSLLKLWLRELEEPLIPSKVYDKCIQYGMMGESDPNSIAGAKAVISELPEINRKVVHATIEFLKKVGEPDNVPFTKMTYNNIAMVFAPNFLRCPSDNPQTIFENTKYEQAFLRILLASTD